MSEYKFGSTKRLDRHRIKDYERLLPMEPYQSRLQQADIDPASLTARLRELLEYEEASPQYGLLKFVIHDMQGFLSNAQGFLSEGKEIPETTLAKLGDIQQALAFTAATPPEQWSIQTLITWAADNGVTFEQGTKTALAHFRS